MDSTVVSASGVHRFAFMRDERDKRFGDAACSRNCEVSVEEEVSIFSVVFRGIRVMPQVSVLQGS
jgi:hypothetical protein